MSNNFFLGSFLGRLKYANQHHKLFVIQRSTRSLSIILKILFKENIIKNYLIKNNYFYIFMRSSYFYKSLIKGFVLTSKPSKRVYVTFYELESILYKNKFCKLILSTDRGIMLGSDAIKLRLGGEILFKIIS